MAKSRLDKYLLENTLVSSRSQANDLIKRSQVKVNGVVISKAGTLVGDTDKIEIIQERIYVNRAALKLVKAIEEFKLNFESKVVLDIGASTGGFTQVCLEAGASKCYCVDVGTNQLHSSLKTDSRVIEMSQTNIKDLTGLAEKIDRVVCDISFISITKFLEHITQFLNNDAELIILLKPQFEAGPERVGKGGIIKKSDREEIKLEVLAWLESKKFHLINICESPIIGKDGNTEYLLHLTL